jgi:hypothetical protein
MSLTVLFRSGATVRPTYVVSYKRGFISEFCATIATKSGVTCSFLLKISLHYTRAHTLKALSSLLLEHFCGFVSLTDVFTQLHSGVWYD